MHAIAGHAIVVGLALLTLICGVLIGRRWRREYRGALATRLRLEQAARSSASASAVAQASGNVVRVDIGRGDHELRGRELYVPRSLRAGFDRWAPGGAEALGDGDELALPESVDDYRPTLASRVLFGSGGAVPRRLDLRGRGSESSEG